MPRKIRLSKKADLEQGSAGEVFVHLWRRGKEHKIMIPENEADSPELYLVTRYVQSKHWKALCKYVLPGIRAGIAALKGVQR